MFKFNLTITFTCTLPIFRYWTTCHLPPLPVPERTFTTFPLRSNASIKCIQRNLNVWRSLSSGFQFYNWLRCSILRFAWTNAKGGRETTVFWYSYETANSKTSSRRELASIDGHETEQTLVTFNDACLQIVVLPQLLAAWSTLFSAIAQSGVPFRA